MPRLSSTPVLAAAASLLLLAAAGLGGVGVRAVPIPTPQGVIETTPYTDARWTESPQKIPGKLWFAYCDKTPEVGYHIATGECKNRCSCTFNKCNETKSTYFDKYRSDECLTVCYTKSSENNWQDNFCCDTWFNNGTQIEPNLPMLGYLYPGNWYSLSVDVAEAGEYAATLFGSSHHGGTLSFDVDLQDQTGNVSVSSTGWWHNFNVWPNLFSLKFDTPGYHLVTVHIRSIAPPKGFKEWGNLVWADFVKKSA